MKQENKIYIAEPMEKRPDDPDEIVRMHQKITGRLFDVNKTISGLINDFYGITDVTALTKIHAELEKLDDRTHCARHAIQKIMKEAGLIPLPMGEDIKLPPASDK